MFHSDCSSYPAHVWVPSKVSWNNFHNLTPKEGRCCLRESVYPAAYKTGRQRFGPCTDFPRLCSTLGRLLLISTRERTRLMHVCESANAHLLVPHELDGNRCEAATNSAN